MHLLLMDIRMDNGDLAGGRGRCRMHISRGMGRTLLGVQVGGGGRFSEGWLLLAPAVGKHRNLAPGFQLGRLGVSTAMGWLLGLAPSCHAAANQDHSQGVMADRLAPRSYLNRSQPEQRGLQDGQNRLLKRI